MPNTTPIFWEIDGVSLNQLAWNISTLTGREGTPPVRGSNLTVPYRPGSVWTPKIAGERIISLGMWVQGCLDDGTVPTDRTFQAQFFKNLRELLRLFHKPYRQVTVTKRWYDDAGVVQSATAQAEVIDSVVPEMNGGARAGMVVDLVLTWPYFEMTEVSDTIPLGTTAVQNDGDAVAYPVIEINGPLTNPVITNQTLDPDQWVKVTDTIASGSKVVLDVLEFTATKGSTNVVGKVTQSGSVHWLTLLPQGNSINVAADSGSGNVLIKHKPQIL